MEHKVLLVDDEPNLLAAVRRGLRDEPYEVLCATSAREAMGILAAEEVDLVISDQQMPGMTGTEFLAWVHREHPDKACFILTGQATLEVAVEAINRGAISRFFLKPCNVVDLASSIRQAIQQRELMVEAGRLLRKVEGQADLLEQIERDNPGITKVQRDSQGVIVLEDPPDDHGTLISRIRETLGDGRGE